MSFTFTKSLLVAGLLAGGAAFTPAKAQAPGNYTYQLVTTIESVVPGGFGRSKVSYTPAFKGVKEAPMENLFSLTGLNMANLQKNEETIVALTQQMAADGYELVQALPLTSSIQGSGIFMTRYIFRKGK
ncbi:hypothetical protein MON38_14050 [Hymenobacter sp. DH14]|uniref:DUF4177 domain-containing protein n=1 Tax=Hymenobacter cyanobacteriorum TaxID=2926463 RepID=A0A9X1VH30_9BACT|nr:hypothetical protein [Hymenobacter cyanobacteriorum]MCI1188548.1 hypothetical protein [Hymenobacter cyanobacteriorum]